MGGIKKGSKGKENLRETNEGLISTLLLWEEYLGELSGKCIFKGHVIHYGWGGRDTSASVRDWVGSNRANTACKEDTL